jgi:hypothetical protein
MTDQLTADVERWLAAEVRTTWPGKSGDCCDTDERAELAAWFAGQIRAFEAWQETHGGAVRIREAMRAIDTEPYLDWESDGTLLEAAASARTSTTYETPSNWPSPEPGTHESDLLVRVQFARSEDSALPGEDALDGRGGTFEFLAAAEWSTVNRQENA